MAYVPLTDVDLANKTVIMRVDFNSPVETTERRWALRSTKRIDDHIRTTFISLFKSENSPRNIVVIAHQGRFGQSDCTTLRRHFEHCRDELKPHDIRVFYPWESIDDAAVESMGEKAVASDEVLHHIRELPDRSILILENVRFSKSEGDTENGKEPEDFANHALIRMLSRVDKRIAALDGFSVAHRAQASVIGLKNLGEHLYAGPVVMREIDHLANALVKPKRPMVLVVGGAKIDDSLRAIRRFLGNNTADRVLTGGLVGLAFLYAQSYPDEPFNKPTLDNLAQSCKDLSRTRRVVEELLADEGEKILVPTDLAVGPNSGQIFDRTTYRVGDPALKTTPHAVGDIGIRTISQYVPFITEAQTIVMNGPMGRYEWKNFSLGTEEVLRFVACTAHGWHAHALIGGGDTGAALEAGSIPYNQEVVECSSGKAFLQALASGTLRNLAGIRALARTE